MLTDDEQFLEAWLRWGRQSASEQLAGLVCGDTKELVVWPGIPAVQTNTGRTISKAWLVIKAIETPAEPTENAAWTAAGGLQSITTAEVVGRGVIVSASEAAPELRFDLTAANTAALTPHKTYHAAVQVKMSDNALYEVERFTFNTRQPLIAATA